MDLLANIDVNDLEKAVVFYGNALGLKVGRRLAKDAVEMLGASSAIYLLARRSGTRASSAGLQRRDYRRHWTPVHLDFVVDNIDQAVTQAQAAGAALEDAIQTHRWGRIALMADPSAMAFVSSSSSDWGTTRSPDLNMPTKVHPYFCRY